METKLFLDNWINRKINVDANAHDVARADIDEYTARKLGETLGYACENSSFYREKYTDRSALPQEADGIELFLDAFEKLPFTTSEELKTCAMEMLCVRPGDISRIVTLDTGGSTGLPKRIYFTEEDQQLTVDFFENGMQLMADADDKVLILMPAKVPGSIGKLLAEGLENFGAKAVCYGLPAMNPAGEKKDNEAEVEQLLELIECEGITGVVALPTHMAMLAELADGQRLRWVLLSAEYVPEEQVKLIGKAFDCKVYEHYGMTEMGLGCAVSCGHGEGYHVRENDLYLEIIDPKTGRRVEDGEVGEIVFTTLTRRGMPFIRYRTGDYSRWITDKCECGSILKRLDKVGPRDAVKGYLKRPTGSDER